MSKDNGTNKIREAVVSGIFYPDDPEELSELVASNLTSASAYRDSSKAIISPHAAFEYCGAIAAAGWISAADRNPKTVVILAPYHRAEEPLVWLPESDAFSTPLGKIPVNARYIQELESCGTIFRVNDIPHFEEHSIEVQLPFMKALFPNASCVPILMGKPVSSTIAVLANSLNLVFAEDLQSVLFVVSSNFSCYSSREETQIRMDRVREFIESGNGEALVEEYGNDPDICGVGCLAALLKSGLLKGSAWKLLLSGDSASKRASPAEKIVYYAAGAWK